MASRRLRTRPDKRSVDFTLPAPDIERAFEKLTAERKRDEHGDEGEPITLKTGETLDPRRPWPMPAAMKG